MSAEVARHVERRISRLPEWPDDWIEPERPQIFIIERQVAGRPPKQTITLDLSDKRSAEWLAHWLSSKDAWERFGDWLDRHR